MYFRSKIYKEWCLNRDEKGIPLDISMEYQWI